MTPFDTDRSYRRGGGGVRLVAVAAASVFKAIFMLCWSVETFHSIDIKQFQIVELSNLPQ